MSRELVLRFSVSEVPLQDGEFARLRVLRGPDFGSTFVIKSSAFTLGRGADATLRISDIKASRSHAKIEFTSKVGWRLVDLGSANGVFYRGEFLREFPIMSGDHFTIGDTIFEFLLNSEPENVLMAPIPDDPELERREVAFAEQKIRVRALRKEVRFSQKNAKKMNPLVLVLGAALAYAYVYPEEAGPFLHEYGLGFVADLIDAPSKVKVAEKKKEKKKEEKKEDRSVASYGAASVAPEVAKTAEQYYRQGFREYKAGHHLRARESFSLALQVNPAHERARAYLEYANRDNENDVKRLINLGRKARDVGRFRVARGYFETALRHSGDDPEDPLVVESREALKSLDEGGTP
jgi:pSer/pThr/pTyr-binding forkhead associated (FHA) protein